MQKNTPSQAARMEWLREKRKSDPKFRKQDDIEQRRKGIKI